MSKLFEFKFKLQLKWKKVLSYHNFILKKYLLKPKNLRQLTKQVIEGNLSEEIALKEIPILQNLIMLK